MNDEHKKKIGICFGVAAIIAASFALHWALFGGGVRDDGGAAEHARTGIENAQREQQDAAESIGRIRSGLADGEHRADSIERRIESSERRASAVEISVESAQSRISECRSVAQDSERRVKECLGVIKEVRRQNAPH